MKFNYTDNNNQIQKLNIKVGKDWNSYKEKTNSDSLNSIFGFVDTNSDSKVDKEELNLLQKLLEIADSQIEKLKNNKIIEKEELELITNAIEEGYLFTLYDKNPEEILPEIIEIPKDLDKLKEYTVTRILHKYDEDAKKHKYYKSEVEIVDYSTLKNLKEGKYHIDYWEKSLNEGDLVVHKPIVVEMQDSNQDGTKNWSEGINRNISKIQLNKATCSKNLLSFMNKVGNEQGFKVELLNSSDGWLEDYSVVRPDKKQVIPNTNGECVLKFYDNDRKVIKNRKQITINKQGSAAQSEQMYMGSSAIRYSYTLQNDDIILGKTYLEGGNVLNTITKNGEPGAIIGEESIKYTMLAMNEEYEIININDLENSDEAISLAKKQIAQELGIKEENVTYIPQFDFHIDMHYRPFNDGQMGVPDYESGINILKNLLQNIDNELNSENIQSELKSNLEDQKEKYQKLMIKLEEMKNKTDSIANNAENVLIEQGYEIIKIPCFTDIDNGYNPFESSVENAINYMNGVCGTSAKTGDKYYITNTSGDKTLDLYMENYFKEVVGFDKIYFAPTKFALESLGGIDCLTKEF